MKANLFEGARRISKLLQMIWVVICFAAISAYSPSVSLEYKAAGPVAPFVRVASCGRIRPTQFPNCREF
jgi:hypothetical protein